MRRGLIAAVAALLLVGAAAAAVLLVPGFGVRVRLHGGSPAPASASSHQTASSVASVTPTPTPSPTASPADTCPAADLNLVVGALTSASGGQEGVVALIADGSGSACLLSGPIDVQMLTSQGAPLATHQGPATTGQAWLVPDRVALDPWEPQPGEADLSITWHTGDQQPGVCSTTAPAAGEVRLNFPGGEITDGLGALSAGSVAPCGGEVDLTPLAQPATAGTFPDALAAAEDGVQKATGLPYSAGPCTPTGTQGCLTGGHVTGGEDAAFAQFQDPVAACTSYVYQDAAGWHPLDTVCTQAGDAPAIGATVTVTVPGGGCANAHVDPGHAATVSTCVAGGTLAGVDGGPDYVAETDPSIGLPMGTLWWHLSGVGWVAHDFVAPADQ
jgi:hypothetical protein